MTQRERLGLAMHLAVVRLWTGFALLGVLAGCASPNSRTEPKATPAIPGVARPDTTPATNADLRFPQAGLPVSYQTPVQNDLSALPEQSANPASAPPDLNRQVSGAVGQAFLPAQGRQECLPHLSIQIGQGTSTVQVAPTPPQSSYSAPEASAAGEPPRFVSGDPCDPFNNQIELSVDQLVAEVQCRNPTLQAASAAWRAAAQRYPQVVSLDDPMFGYMIGPQGVGRDNGGGWMVEASQKIPWAGKRGLRGNAAQAEADAMRGDIGTARLRLAEAARMAFYDYYLARRQVEVNEFAQDLLTQFRDIAKNKYEANQATEQDVLQADLELAALEIRRAELMRDEQVAIARINTLLHRTVDHLLPPPPARILVPQSLPAAESLQEAAIRSRPDLYAQQSRIRAEQAGLALAHKEYAPDLELVTKYDGFMPEEMRPQVGMNINVPLRSSRRSAAVREASERLRQRCAEYQEQLDAVRFEVQSAFSRAVQAERSIGLYQEKLLSAAERNLESARANYTSGKLDFLRLIDAERQINSQREMYYQAMVEYHRRLAELERAVGETVAF